VKLTALVTLAVFACATPVAIAPPAAAQAPPKPSVAKASAPHVPLLVALAQKSDDGAWISPGPLQLEAGAVAIQPVDSSKPIEVAVVDEQGRSLHVGVKLPAVAFGAWVERASLYSILARDTRVIGRDGSDFQPATTGEPIEAMLKAGALVRRLAHQEHWTRVRYFGGVEIEGWVPDDALADHGAAHDAGSLRARGSMVQTMLPGSVIRTEARWAAHALATTANTYFVDTIKEIDDAWLEVAFEDGDVKVHGFVSKHDPPGRVHRPPEVENAQAIAPNGKLVAGTCLYVRAGGEPIGFAVQEAPAEIAAGTRADWFDVAVDTPWGPITFAATGASETDLSPCPATSP
jgi:hypothetical protein